MGRGNEWREKEKEFHDDINDEDYQDFDISFGWDLSELWMCMFATVVDWNWVTAMTSIMLAGNAAMMSWNEHEIGFEGQIYWFVLEIFCHAHVCCALPNWNINYNLRNNLLAFVCERMYYLLSHNVRYTLPHNPKHKFSFNCWKVNFAIGKFHAGKTFSLPSTSFSPKTYCEKEMEGIGARKRMLNCHN
jgi:hypothetical protein